MGDNFNALYNDLKSLDYLKPEETPDVLYEKLKNPDNFKSFYNDLSSMGYTHPDETLDIFKEKIFAKPKVIKDKVGAILDEAKTAVKTPYSELYKEEQKDDAPSGTGTLVDPLINGAKALFKYAFGNKHRVEQQVAKSIMIDGKNPDLAVESLTPAESDEATRVESHGDRLKKNKDGDINVYSLVEEKTDRGDPNAKVYTPLYMKPEDILKSDKVEGLSDRQLQDLKGQLKNNSTIINERADKIELQNESKLKRNETGQIDIYSIANEKMGLTDYEIRHAPKYMDPEDILKQTQIEGLSKNETKQLQETVAMSETIKRTNEAKQLYGHLNLLGERSDKINQELEKKYGKEKLQKFAQINQQLKDIQAQSDEASQDPNQPRIDPETNKPELKPEDIQMYKEIAADPLMDRMHAVSESWDKYKKEADGLPSKYKLDALLSETQDNRQRLYDVNWSKKGPVSHMLSRMANAVTESVDKLVKIPRQATLVAGSVMGSEDAATELTRDTYGLSNKYERTSTSQRPITEKYVKVPFEGTDYEISYDSNGNYMGVYDDVGLATGLMNDKEKFKRFNQTAAMLNPAHNLLERTRVDAIINQAAEVVTDFAGTMVLSGGLGAVGKALSAGAKAMASETGVVSMLGRLAESERFRESASVLTQYSGRSAEQAIQAGETNPEAIGTYALWSAAQEGLTEGILPQASRIADAIGGKIGTALTKGGVRSLVEGISKKGAMQMFLKDFTKNIAAETLVEEPASNIIQPFINRAVNNVYGTNFDGSMPSMQDMKETVMVTAAGSFLPAIIGAGINLRQAKKGSYIQEMAYMAAKEPEVFKKYLNDYVKKGIVTKEAADHYNKILDKTVVQASSLSPDAPEEFKKAYTNIAHNLFAQQAMESQSQIGRNKINSESSVAQDLMEEFHIKADNKDYTLNTIEDAIHGTSMHKTYLEDGNLRKSMHEDLSQISSEIGKQDNLTQETKTNLFDLKVRQAVADKMIKNLREDRSLAENKQPIDDRISELNTLKSHAEAAFLSKEAQIKENENVKGKPIYSDFDNTVFNPRTGEMTKFGLDLKQKIANGENVTILTAREDTPQNRKLIADKLGIDPSRIKLGLNPDAKAAALEPGSVFYDDNPNNVAAATARGDVHVVNMGEDEMKPTPKNFHSIESGDKLLVDGKNVTVKNVNSSNVDAFGRRTTKVSSIEYETDNGEKGTVHLKNGQFVNSDNAKVRMAHVFTPSVSSTETTNAVADPKKIADIEARRSAEKSTVAKTDVEKLATIDAKYDAELATLDKNQNIKAFINVAPLYNVQVKTAEQANALKESPMYQEYIHSVAQLANNMGITVNGMQSGIGGFGGSSEVTSVMGVTGTWEDIVNLAATVGAFTPEVQEATIAARFTGEDSTDHNAHLYELEISDPEIAVKAARAVGMEDTGYTITNNTLTLFDIFDYPVEGGIEKLISNFEAKLHEYGGTITKVGHRNIQSEYIDAEARKDRLAEIARTGSTLRQGGASYRDAISKAQERNEKFLQWKKLSESPEAVRYRELRNKQISEGEAGRVLSDTDLDELKTLEKKLVEPLSALIADSQALTEAKAEIEDIANQLSKLVTGGFVSEFGIKNPDRAAVKIVRWYSVQPTRLGDGARTNIIVNNDGDADFLFNEIQTRFSVKGVDRSVNEETDLGYPKRLVEVRTSNGKIAEIQVMTPQGYLAKDGINYFADKQFAKNVLTDIRKKLGWNIPDGIGHFFYELHRDPNVPNDLREKARVLSVEYYYSMLNPEISSVDGENFRNDLNDLRKRVAASDKSHWDPTNKGIMPETGVRFIEGVQPVTTEAPVTESKSVNEVLKDKSKQGQQDQAYQAAWDLISNGIGVDDAVNQVVRAQGLPSVMASEMKEHFNEVVSDQMLHKIANNLGDISFAELKTLVQHHESLGKTRGEAITAALIEHDSATEIAPEPSKVYTASNINEISTEGMNDVQTKVIKDVKNVFNAVNSLVKGSTGNDLSVHVHTDSGTYANAVAEAGGTQQDSDTKGFYLSGDGTIHLNMDRVTSETMLHEGFHPVLDYIAENNPGRLDEFFNQLKSIDPSIVAQAEKLYKGDATIKKEAITDFIARVADGSYNVQKSGYEKVRDFFTNILNKLGFNIGNDINSISDIKRLAQVISQKFNAGQSVGSGKVSVLEPGVQYSRQAVSSATEALVVPGKRQPAMVFNAMKNKEEYVAYAGDTSTDALKEFKPDMYINRAIYFANDSDLIGGKVKKFKEGATKEEKLKWADSVYDRAKKTVVSNLLYLYDNIPENVRVISKLWYDGANKIALEMANKYNITHEQSSAIIASLSPQKPWFDNLHIAHFIMDFHTKNQDSVFSKEVYDYYEKTGSAYPEQVANLPNLKNSIGKKYSELSDYDKSVFVRYEFDNKYERTAPLRLPTGHIIGRTKGKSSYSGYNKIASAIRIMMDGSDQTISDNIGNDSKVRNFYNNIIDPTSDKHVTIDTHAMAAGFLLPLGSADPEVSFDFGTYSFFHDAYTTAAKERDVLPRELQSITWEGIKSLFPPTFKRTGIKEKARELWAAYKAGNETIENIQQTLKRDGKDISKTDWSGFIDRAIESGETGGYLEELPLAGRTGSTTGEGSGSGSNGEISSMGGRDSKGDGVAQFSRVKPEAGGVGVGEDNIKDKIKITLSGKFTNVEGADNAVNEIKGLGEPNQFNDKQVVIDGVKVNVERDGGKIWLKEITAIEQGKGTGTKVLKQIQDIADKNDIDIVLHPTKIKNTTDAQLKKWYNDNGFEDYTQGRLIYKAKSREEIGDARTSQKQSLKGQPQFSKSDPNTVPWSEVKDKYTEVVWHPLSRTFKVFGDNVKLLYDRTLSEDDNIENYIGKDLAKKVLEGRQYRNSLIYKLTDSDFKDRDFNNDFNKNSSKVTESDIRERGSKINKSRAKDLALMGSSIFAMRKRGTLYRVYDNSDIDEAVAQGDSLYTVDSIPQFSKSPLSEIQPSDIKNEIIKKELPIKVSPSADQAIKSIEDKGGKVLVVGGAVRDALLGKEPKDIDVEVYNTNYKDLEETLSKFGNTNLVGKAFGIVKFTDPQGNEYDFSLPRRESKVGVGHKDFNVTVDATMTPKDAAERRDFTWNGLAYDINKGEIHDYYNGIHDLKAQIVKHTSDKFAEDPLRILRAMQFQSRFGFDIDPATIAEMKKMVDNGELDHLPKERISEEWMKWATKGTYPSKMLNFLHDIGLDSRLPYIAKLKGTPQDPEWHPEGDVEIHTGHVMDAAARIAEREGIKGDDRAVLMFAALTHDFAKPGMTETTIINGKERITSRGHEKAGGPLAEEFLKSIGIKQSIIDRVVPLVENHLEHANISSVKDERGRISATKKLAKRLKDSNIAELLNLVEADASGRPPLQQGLPESGKMLRDLAEKVGVSNKAESPILTGRHLIEMGMKPSKAFGPILEAAMQAQTDGQFSTVEEGKQWVQNNIPKVQFSKADDNKVTDVVSAISDPKVKNPLGVMLSFHESKLTDVDKSILLIGLDKGAFDAEAMQAYQLAFEQYLQNGTSGNSHVDRVLEKPKTWISKLYNTITVNDIPINITPQARELFSSVIGIRKVNADFGASAKKSSSSETWSKLDEVKPPAVVDALGNVLLTEPDSKDTLDNLEVPYSEESFESMPSEERSTVKSFAVAGSKFIQRAKKIWPVADNADPNLWRKKLIEYALLHSDKNNNSSVNKNIILTALMYNLLTEPVKTEATARLLKQVQTEWRKAGSDVSKSMNSRRILRELLGRKTPLHNKIWGKNGIFGSYAAFYNDLKEQLEKVSDENLSEFENDDAFINDKVEEVEEEVRESKRGRSKAAAIVDSIKTSKDEIINRILEKQKNIVC